MFYKVKIGNEYKFMTDASVAELVADGVRHSIEMRCKWLEGVVRDMPDEWSDGEVLDEVIKLIDEGACNA